ncbi:MAG: YitT family protein [Mycoplasmatales bacterium]
MNFKKGIYLVIGVFLMALAVNTVTVPNEIISGGITGLATIIYSYWGVNTALFVFIANLSFLVLAFMFISKEFAIKSIVGANILFPIFMYLIPIQSISQDNMLACIFGGVVSGIALYFLNLSNGSTGGTTITGKLVSKVFGTSFALGCFICDSLIVLLGWLAFGIESTLYALIYIVVMVFVAEYLETGFKKAKVVQIITDDPDSIRIAAIDDIGRSVTLIDAVGGYKGTSKTMIICIVKVRELAEVESAIYKADPKSFVFITTASSTYGEGFTVYKDTID